MGLLILILILIIGILAYYLRKKNKQLARYEGLTDVEAEQEKIKKETESIKSKAEKDNQKLQAENDKLKKEGRDIRSIVAELKSQLGDLQDDSDMAEFGLYRPKYNFESSEKYKKKLEETRQKQKALIKSKTAINWGTEWSVGNSKTEGRRMMERQTKLTLRAFNGECDSIIDKVKYNNLFRIQDRVTKVYEAINKINQSQQCRISHQYLQLKVEELHIVHEYREKVQEEKEEQRRIREQMREEQKALKEIEKAQKDAEREEARYQKALEKARSEMEKATGEKHNELEGEIARLNEMLEEAQRNKERAISQAQMTKSGHVYIISNVGSFGEGVYKIGMTRRLEPLDRVKELGDASVPFLFDVHAMIYSENAPELESHLHKAFENRRVNQVNNRKEFFRVGLDEIVKVVKKKAVTVEFTMKAEAEEYRKTQALLAEQNKKVNRTQEFSDMLDS